MSFNNILFYQNQQLNMAVLSIDNLSKFLQDPNNNWWHFCIVLPENLPLLTEICLHYNVPINNETSNILLNKLYQHVTYSFNSQVTSELNQQPIIICNDVLQVLPTMNDGQAQIIIADPPYNIGKNFGNNSDKQNIDEYLNWCEIWIKECLRVLMPNGTMFIYGFSETLALILSRVPSNINRRWLIWHYTNKTTPTLNFWQRSHESILCLWKSDKVFHRDEVREPYTDAYTKCNGKKRAATSGRFGNQETTYEVNENGALPRDVIKIPALAGGAGKKERVDHPTQKPIELCLRLLKSCYQQSGYVFVPFAGSGSEILACKQLNLPCVGVEINPQYCNLIHSRLTDNI